MRSLVSERLIQSSLKEWRKEGIPFSSIDVPEFSGLLDLLHRPSSGIFAIVDAASALGDSQVHDGTSDLKMLANMQQHAAKTSSGARSAFFALAGPASAYRRAETDFVVRHTFGSVVYSCTGFECANRGGVSSGLADVLRQSSDAFVALLFSGEQPRDAAASPTIAQRWSTDLEFLCDRLSTSPALHIVQCIKVSFGIFSLATVAD